ncbi:PREDICTED: PWWP domain-containing protein MUM1-like [Dipodomys ordii]|uniref:PWWP domain-containing protein MUM1-like n=1 Tax=Dipodomys ordii TaxID=10020 RepID=A0A1S3GTF6_DIPOR|nr:PREDICTED: PWWP domain-containing protein MUM1-like [Dipodomys ordii]
MESAEYILCSWKEYLWPAKVVPVPGTPVRSKSGRELPVKVQILTVDEKMQVESADVMDLTEAGIEAIASSVGVRLRITDPPVDVQWKTTGPSGQLRLYRKALRLALDILYCRKLAEQRKTTKPPKTGLKASSTHHGLSIGLGLVHGPRRKRRKRKLYYAPKLRKQKYLRSQQGWLSGNELVESSSRFIQRPTPVRAVSENEDKEKSTALIPVPCCHPVVWEGPPDKAEFPALSIQPVVILSKVRNRSQKTVDTGRETTASDRHKIAAFPEIMEEPEEIASNAALEGEIASSQSLNSRLPDSLSTVNQKRKRQDLTLKRAGKKFKSPEFKAVATKKSAGRRREAQAKSMAPKWKTQPIKRGMLVWFKLHGYPFWPAVVKRVIQTTQMARVLLIEANMCPAQSGIPVHLCRLKPLDCDEKDKLVRRASKDYSHGVTWCFSFINHYREAVTKKSFTGSFFDYFTSNASYLARKALEETDHTDFPKVNYSDLEDSDEETVLGKKRPRKKLLPDRMKAARDKSNRKLVDFIVKKKGADKHLQDIITGRKESRWLTSFLKPRKSLVCIETYLEDDDQLYEVAKHLQKLYDETDKIMFHLLRGDKESFIMEVLLPEAMIYSIATVDELSYQKAEEKYLRGPPLHYREKAEFDKKVLKERKRRRRRLEITTMPFMSLPALPAGTLVCL